MAQDYIRCLTRMVPVTETWRKGYTDSYIIILLYITKQGRKFLTCVSAKDRTGHGFCKTAMTNTLSEAASTYDLWLDSIFNSIPCNVTADWFVNNEFSKV